MKYTKQQALHIRCSFNPDKLLQLIETMEGQILNNHDSYLLFLEGKENEGNEDNKPPDLKN